MRRTAEEAPLYSQTPPAQLSTYSTV